MTDLRATLTFVRDALDDLAERKPDADLGMIHLAVQRGTCAVQELRDLIDTRLVRRSTDSEVPAVRHRGFLRQQRIERLCAAMKEARLGLATALSAIQYLQM